MAGAREPSMEDILASIKRVIAEEKEIRASAPPAFADEAAEEDDILELDESMAEPGSAPVDLGPPLLEDDAADTSRMKLEALASVAATAPPAAQVNPMEDMVREMLRPILKQWLDDHLPSIVDEHVKREIHRITGRPF
jgi:cell pole-organizing protein PopZ